MQPKFKKMLYGGDYNPNQWPKEIWDEDMKLFHQAGINSTTINVFSWAKIQPSENEYDFTELDEIVDTLTICKTPGRKTGRALRRQQKHRLLAHQQ